MQHDGTGTSSSPETALEQKRSRSPSEVVAIRPLRQQYTIEVVALAPIREVLIARPRTDIQLAEQRQDFIRLLRFKE